VLIGSQVFAASWTDGFETGYAESCEPVKSPWVQQTNDSSLIGGADLDLHVSKNYDWWMAAYSGSFCLGQYGYHWGLISRPTGAASTDVDVVAQFVSFNQSDSAQLLVLSPQADHAAAHWTTVPGSVGMKVDYYHQSVTFFSVNSAGVATSNVTSRSIGGWQWWRIVAPKASGAQTVSAQVYNGSDWTTLTTIDTDASFKASYLGLGMYSCGFADEIGFKSIAGAVDPDKIYAVTGPMCLYKDPSTGKVVSVVLVKDFATDIVEF